MAVVVEAGGFGGLADVCGAGHGDAGDVCVLQGDEGPAERWSQGRGGLPAGDVALACVLPVRPAQPPGEGKGLEEVEVSDG